MAGSGGFRPSLVTTSDGVTPEASVLASEHGMVKRAGLTLDSTAVSADSDGNKVVKVGTVLACVDATGKYVPWDDADAAVEGTYSATEPTAILVDASVNLRHGDVITGGLIHGSVLRARLVNLTDDAEATFSGRVIFQ